MKIEGKPTPFPYDLSYGNFHAGDVVRIKGERGRFTVKYFADGVATLFGGTHYNPGLPALKREGEWRSVPVARITHTHKEKS